MDKLQKDLSTDTPYKQNKQQPKTAIIIANPTAGSYQRSRKQIETAIEYLKMHGWQIDLKLTEAAEDERKFTREAVLQQMDVVIAVGGDGTINNIIQELAGTQTALGVLPGGTVNVWAREMLIPLDIQKACEVLINGQTHRIDLGKVNDHYFLLMASVGFDAEVTQSIEKKPAKRFGILSYLALGTWLSFQYPSFLAFLRTAKQNIRTRTVQIVFGNTQLYAGTISFTWKASCNDGLLDICIVRNTTILSRFLMVVDFLLRRPRRQQWVRYETSEEVLLNTNKPVAIQVDGDPKGYTTKYGTPPTVIRIVPRCLNVIVPQDAPETLFSNKED